MSFVNICGIFPTNPSLLLADFVGLDFGSDLAVDPDFGPGFGPDFDPDFDPGYLDPEYIWISSGIEI